jgi:hypothetical protein
MANHLKLTARKKKAFCKKLIETGGNVSAAASAVRLSRSAVYEMRAQDDDFKLAWDDAREQGVDALEEVAYKRAFSGVQEPVFFQGEECGTVTRYSDKLAEFLLRGNRPEKYKENTDLNLSGASVKIEYVNDWRNLPAGSQDDS